MPHKKEMHQEPESQPEWSIPVASSQLSSQQAPANTYTRKNEKLSLHDGDLAALESTGLLSESVDRDEVEDQTIELDQRKMNYKRQTQPSYTKRVLESFRDGSAIFAGTQGLVTLAVPNPVTAIAAGISGAVSAVTGVIAGRIDK